MNYESKIIIQAGTNFALVFPFLLFISDFDFLK